MISARVFSRLSVPLSLSSHQFRHFSKSSLLAMPIKVGDKFPAGSLYEGTPKDAVNVQDFLAGKKAVIFGVPGAFTPGCSATHLPGYVEQAENLKAAGVDVLACISVNDPFVMAAWGENQGVDGKIRMLADPQAEVTKAMGLDKDLTAALGNVRSSRYSMIVVDGVVKVLNMEPDGTGMTCSLAPNLQKQLKDL